MIEFPVDALSDGVVHLRLIAEADIPAIVDAVQDPEIPRWTRVPQPYTLSAAIPGARQTRPAAVRGRCASQQSLPAG